MELFFMISKKINLILNIALSSYINKLSSIKLNLKYDLINILQVFFSITNLNRVISGFIVFFHQ